MQKIKNIIPIKKQINNLIFYNIIFKLNMQYKKIVVFIKNNILSELIKNVH